MAATWRNGKRWVYSITYDEGLEALLDNVVPLHRRYGLPGHVALVAVQVGVPRDVPGSSFDGYPILSRDQVHALRAEGWGVSCHGLTHAAIDDNNAEREVVSSRQLLIETLGMPVTMFCVPNNNHSYPAARRVAQRAGYEAVMTIYDDINTRATDLLRLARVPLCSVGYEPFSSTFDPYKRLHQAVDAGGWVIDYCHCPMPGRPVHPSKDCSLEELEARFETVLRVGGDGVWLAEPHAVVAELLATRGKS